MKEIVLKVSDKDYKMLKGMFVYAQTKGTAKEKTLEEYLSRTNVEAARLAPQLRGKIIQCA